MNSSQSPANSGHRANSGRTQSPTSHSSRELLERAIAARLLSSEQAQWAWQHATQSQKQVALILVESGLLSRDQLKSLKQSNKSANPVAESHGPRLPAPGDVVDQFTIKSNLGQGGMGAVFLAISHEQKRVAIKFLLSSKPQDSERFLREAQAIAKVDHHPNIVRVYSVGEWHQQPYIVLEYVPGGSLEALLKTNVDQSQTEILTLLQKVSDALSIIHKAGLVHRDIKPANILIREDDNEPLITDFGLVKSETAATLTNSQELTGTPHYMAPEQIAGQRKEIGPATDIWAVGVLAYRLATGELPFKARSNTELSAQILMGDVVNPCKLRASISVPLANLILNCLEKKPEQRYQTASALSLACSQLLSGGSVSRTNSWFGRTAQKTGLSARAALIVVSLLFVLGILGAFGHSVWQNSQARWRSERLNRLVNSTLSRKASDCDRLLAAAIYRRFIIEHYGPGELKDSKAPIDPLRKSIQMLKSIDQHIGELKLNAQAQNFISNLALAHRLWDTRSQADYLAKFLSEQATQQIDQQHDTFVAGLRAQDLKTWIPPDSFSNASKHATMTVHAIYQGGKIHESKMNELRLREVSPGLFDLLQFEININRYLISLFESSEIESRKHLQPLILTLQNNRAQYHVLQQRFHEQALVICKDKDYRLLQRATALNYRFILQFPDLPLIHVSAEQAYEIAQLFLKSNQAYLYSLYFYMAHIKSQKYKLPLALQSDISLATNADYILAKVNNRQENALKVVIFIAHATRLGYFAIFDDQSSTELLNGIDIPEGFLRSGLGTELKLISLNAVCDPGKPTLNKRTLDIVRAGEKLLDSPRLTRQFRTVIVRVLHNFYEKAQFPDSVSRIKRLYETYHKPGDHYFDISPYESMRYFQEYCLIHKDLTFEQRENQLDQMRRIEKECYLLTKSGKIILPRTGLPIRKTTDFKHFGRRLEIRRRRIQLLASADKHQEVVEIYRKHKADWSSRHLLDPAMDICKALEKHGSPKEIVELYKKIKSKSHKNVAALKEYLIEHKLK